MRKNLLFFLLAIASHAVHAQSYTLTRGIPLAEISGTGTPITDLGYNNSVGPFNIGFSFPFFENNYTQFYLAANGHVSFGNNNSSLVNAIPEASLPNNILAFATIRWNGGESNPTLDYFTSGTAPDRILVINFKNVKHSFNNIPCALQIQLYETSGKIEIHYTSFSTGPEWKTTIGIENSTGSIGITNKDLNNKYDVNINNETIRFERIINCSGTVSVNSSSNFLCNGSSTLTASVSPTGSYTYQWYKNSVAIAGESDINYSATEEGTYFVRIKGNDNCIKQSNDITLVNNLVATLSKDTSYVCNGISVNTSVSGNYTYQWFKDNLAIPGETFASTEAQSTGNYKVEVSIGNCTVASNTTKVIKNSVYAYSVNANMCNNAGLGLNLSSSPDGVTYSWSGPNGFTNTTNLAFINNVKISDAGIYSVTVNFGCGDIQTATSELTVVPISLMISSNNNFYNCPGKPMQMSVSWDSNAPIQPTYSWSGPNNFSSTIRNPSFTLTPDNVGVYTITVNLGACGISTTTTSITMNTPAFLASSSPGLMLCETNSIELYTLLNSSSTDNIPDPTTATYTWVGPNNFTSNLRNPTISNLTTAEAGFYTVTVSLSNGCTGTYTSKVAVNVTKNPGLTTRYLAGILCSGYQATLIPNVNPLGNTVMNCIWTGPNGFSSNQVSPTITANGSGGVYTLTATFTGGCTGTYISYLSVPGMEKPELHLNNTLSVCEGKQLSLSISNLSVNNNLVFSWRGPNNFKSNQAQPIVSANANANMTGVYTLNVIDVSGACPEPFIASTTVTVEKCRPCSLTASNSSSIYHTCPGSTVSLFSTLNFPTYYAPSYSWSGPNGFTSTERLPKVNNITESGIYTVTATSYECDGAYTATTFVTVNTETSTPSLFFSTNNFCENNLLIFNPTTDIASLILYYSITGPNGYSYFYSPPYTPPFGYNGPISALSDMSGTYTVNAIYKQICSNTIHEQSVSSNVTVNARPTPPTISGLPTTIEKGESTTLTANGCSGTNTIVWNNGSSANPLVVNPTVNSEYWAICSANECVSPSSNRVTISLNSCPEQFVLVNPTQNYAIGNILKRTKISNGNITATNFVTGNANVTYQAKSILLNAGFKADNGTVFKAEVGGCN